MSWVYCAPKSRMSTREEWMSGCGWVVLIARLLMSLLWIGSGNPVVRCFLGDLHVVYVALAHAGTGDAHELRLGAHRGNTGAAGVTHGGTQATGELVQDGHEAALVGHAPLDALRHEFFELAGGVLEIAVGRAMAFGHGAE